MNDQLTPVLRRSWAIIIALVLVSSVQATAADKIVRVFIFAGQSNMVGSDSKVKDIKRFPPFVGLETVQPNVKFSYCLGRENKSKSNGWVPLQPVNNIVGPELSFARQVTRRIDAPIAIIKCAAGGTHLGGDWNPDQPDGFKMYPLALELIKASLKELDEQGIAYRIEGFMWHQGENDMFNEQYMANYGKNLANFLARWRRDLKTPDLKFYLGELCTKTIWGMDLRPRMYAISKGQKAVAAADPLAEYIPTSHVGVEIGGGVGLHYHYGTLGQLEHGVNYADAYLRTIGASAPTTRLLKQLSPCTRGSVDMFSFTERKKLVDLNPYLRRICDLTTPNLATPILTTGVDGDRAENRYNRMVPTLFSPWRDEQPVLDECLVGLTTDIADRGVGLVFNQPFRADAVMLAYWISTDAMEQPWYFLGSIRRSQSIGGGFWKVGVELQEFANEQYSERLAVLEPMAAKLLTPAEFAIS